MDIAGVAIGLPGLLISCLELVERVEFYKNSEIDARQLVVRLRANELKLRQWASGVGISDDRLSDRHNTQLDDSEVAALVKLILSSLCDIFQRSEHTKTRLRLPPEQENSTSSPWPILRHKDIDVNKTRLRLSSVKRGIAWVGRFKNPFTNQVETFEVLVDMLYELVPPNRREGHIQKNDQGDCIDAIESLNAFSKFQRDLNVLMEETKRNAVSQAYKAIDEWLDAMEFDEQYDKHVSARLEGTCNWIFHHPAYREWVSIEYPDKAAKFLWICGPAGHGKSVLCGRLVQHLAEPAAFPLAYVFSSSHVQAGGQPDGIIRSWISQWVRRDRIVFDLVRDNLQSEKAARRASRAEVWAMFETIVSQVENCTCILDGFDEYSRSDNSRRDFLRGLKEVLAGTRTRCLIASRAETDIEPELSSGVSNPEKQTMLECRLSKNEIQDDIVFYSKTVVAKRLPKKDKSLQQELAASMVEKCEGMFLWIKLQQEQLRSGKSKKELRNIVESMPNGLDQSYARNWASIMNLPNTDCQRAISILRWTTFALRPLTIAELTEALIVEPGADSANLAIDEFPEDIDQDYIDEEIKALCGSLVEVRSNAPESPSSSQTIHLVHVSVKEYLLSVLPAPLGVRTISTSISPDAAQNTDLAKVCLRYLNFENVWEATNIFGKNKEHRPFLDYAANFWFSHQNATGMNDDVANRLLNKFFQPENSNFGAWATYFESSNPESRLKLESEPSTSLYYASLFGFTSTMKYLYDLGTSDIDFAGGRFGTALQSACVAGHIAAFNYLIEWGVNVNAKGGEFGTALNAAVVRGHETMVKFLVDREASPALTDARGRTPLYLACRSGHMKIVQFLLEARADVSTLSKGGWTPLHSAANSGHLEVVKLLLDRGADMSTPNKGGWTPLHSAANSGHLEVVKLLLDSGADMSISSRDRWTPLNSAADSGHLEVVELLLDRGADKSSSSKGGWTPLHSAADNGHLEVMKLLLDRGAKISTPNKGGWTPLNSAANSGHLEVVTALLDRGADMSTPSKGGWTPLNSAANSGHLEVVKLLLDRGAKISTPNKGGWTPLHSAANSGHLEVVKLLLDSGADMSISSRDRWTPLNSAADSGHLEVVKLLLDRGADMSTPNKGGWTPLHSAADSGHLEVVKLLLDSGADMSISSRDRWTPLNSAANSGHLEVVKLLLDSGADMSISSRDRWTPLNSAVDSGHLEVVELLLDRGADKSSSSKGGWTPLHSAADNGHLEVVKLLLDRGADMSTPNKGGWTPLNSAADNGHLEVVELLLDRGADISTSSKDRWTPLNSAADNGHLEVVKLLLDRGAKISTPNKGGWTPLHSAASRGHLEVAKLLLDKGADIDSKDSCHVTPLSAAICSGNEDVVGTLIERGADLSSVDIYGRTCLDWVRLLGSRFEKFGQWTDGYHEDLSNDRQIKHLRQSVHDISHILIQIIENTDGLGFHQLGHCLKFMGLVKEATFAFQQQIQAIDDCGLASHDVFCSICRSSPISGVRRVCQICPDMDMCETCFNNTSDVEIHPVCQNHPFLEVSIQDSKITSIQSTGTNREDINTWLEALCSRV